MLNAQIISLKRQGKENVTHKPAIENEDLLKLKSSVVLALSNPLALFRNVWFHVVLFFCRRGREGQRQLKPSSFKFEVDPSGRKFVTMTHDELTKNHPGGVGDVSSTEKYARMYETEDVNDGYKALELYISKLNPKCDSLFQYPRRNWSVDDSDNVWYEARPLGVNKFDGMMKAISEEAQLSKLYTNHCVTATAITLWSNAGIPNRHIMAISGHRNEQSLSHYNTRPSTSQLRNCSEVLSRSLVTGTSESDYTTIIHKEVQNHSLVVTQSDKTTANPFGSIFTNCTVQNVNIVMNTNSADGDGR
ncbi:hypothetical protein QZH41_001174 [Actinostola sp. cb2023]|nr:hypothetical protein QZH41_001174 [Actinostola sp. cb2023]